MLPAAPARLSTTTELAQPLTQRLGDQPRADIGAAARREGNDEAEGFVGCPAGLGVRALAAPPASTKGPASEEGSRGPS